MAPLATTRDPRPAAAIEALRAARFHVRRKGYDIGEVDGLLQRCLAGLELLAADPGVAADAGSPAWDAFWDRGGSAAAPIDDRDVVGLIAAARLPSRRKGYDEGEVDALLARLVAILDGPTPEPGPPPAEPSDLRPSPPAPAPAPAGPGITEPARTEPAPADPPSSTAAPEPSAETDDLEGRFVRHVVDASLRSAQRVADAAWIRREAERLLLEVHEANIAQVEHQVERECARLRQAAVEQCAAIVAEARAEADRTLAAVSARVDQQLAQVRRDALDELERIVADERRGLAEARPRAAGEVGSPAEPMGGPGQVGSWDRASVERHGDGVRSLYSGERAPADGGHA